MKKKLLILLSTLVVALLAFSLSACDLNLNKAAKITINITRTDKAKDCDIEVTSSYGELTKNGDIISISINLLKNFAVTLSSNGFATENVTVTPNDIKNGSATYNVTFGNTVPAKHEATIFEEYPNLTITSTLDTVSIEIKDQQALFNNPNKYSNPDITIAADGFEPLILPYNELIALPTIKLVRPGYAQIIYAVSNNYSTPNITLKDDRHRLYSPKIIGRNLYFEVPLYDGIYRSAFTSDKITANKAYGTVIQYGSNYNDAASVEISEETYNYLKAAEYTSYQLDKDGKFIRSLSVNSNNYQGSVEYSVHLKLDCESIVLFNYNDSQYATVKKSEIDTFDYENLQYNNVTLYTTLYNSLNNQQLENFSIKHYVAHDNQYTTIQSIDGRIMLDNQDLSGYFQYVYNDDSYEQFFYNQNINYYGDHSSTFIDGDFTFNNTVRPQINLQLEVYDGDRLLQGGNDILSGLAFSDGYYIKTYWDNNQNLVNIGYSSQNYSNDLTAVYIDITKLEKVGEKTYRYKKPVYINNNNHYNVNFTINGESITTSNSSQPKADCTIFNGNSGQWYIETSKESITFYLTFNNTNYKITLNAIDFPADGTEFVYDLSLEN